MYKNLHSIKYTYYLNNSINKALKEEIVKHFISKMLQIY